MAFFYTDSGSFNNLEVSGSTTISGSLRVTGSTIISASTIGLGHIPDPENYLLGTGTQMTYGNNNGSATLTIATPTAGLGTLYFAKLNPASGLDKSAAGLQYNHSTSTLAVLAGSDTRLYLNNSALYPNGTVDLGTTSAKFVNVYATNFVGTASLATSASFITFTPASASFASTASFVNALTTLTASNVQLNSLSDTTATNKVLVLNTSTNQIFTTASVGTGGSATIPPGTVSSSAFSSPSQGTVRATINGVNTDVDTGLQTGDSPSFSGLTSTGTVLLANIYSASNQVTISSTTGYSTFSSSIATKNDIQDISINSLNAATSSYAINSTIQTQLANVVSSSAQVKTLLPQSTVSSSAFSSPSQGTVRATINGANTDVDTGLQTSDSPTFAGLTSTGTVLLQGIFSSSTQVDYNNIQNKLSGVISSSTQFNALTNTSSSFATTAISASYFSGSATFPDGLTVTSLTSSVAQFTGLVDTTSANKVLVLNTATNQIFTTASVGTGGGGSGTGFPYNGQTVPAVISGSLVVSGSKGIYLSGSGMTGSVFSGSFFNIIEMSMAVSGTITATGTTTVILDLNQANYFSVSGSAAGTVTWQLINTPPVGRAQTFVIEYTNGGIKTNSWFTNTRWPAGVAPTLTATTAPDLLGFTTDDAGANWRGVLLQRASA